MGLGAVLQHPHAEARGQPAGGVDVDRLAVEVDGDDADRARRRLGGGVVGVDRVELVGVDEDRDRLGEADGLDRRKRGVRRHQDLVAGFHPQPAQREPQPGRRRVAQDAVPGADVARQLGLELAALRPEDVLSRVDGGQHGLLDLVVDRRSGQGNLRHVHAPGLGSESRSYLPLK